MKILLINKFLYPKGGDAISTLTTANILKKRGHQAVLWGMTHPDNPPYPYEDYFIDNVDYESGAGLFKKSITALNILYSFEAKRKIEPLMSEFKPDIVHLNNFAHQISPSILDTIKRHKIPVVMTMHDFKLVCPAYSLLSNGKPCEKCKNGAFYCCGLNRCTKNSRFKSLINVAEMYLHHNILHIYDKIDLFIAPSSFMQTKVREMGMKGRVEHLSNCIDADQFKPVFDWEENSIVYLGRLSHEKGIKTLIESVKGLDVKLKIIGSGPSRKELTEKVQSEMIPNVRFLGYKSGQELHREIQKSKFLVIPSECYENNPLTVIEAFALGKPVVGARIGGITELVKDGKTGVTFTSGDPAELGDTIRKLISDPESIPEMGKTARKFVETQLNADLYYEKLISLYKSAGNHSF